VDEVERYDHMYRDTNRVVSLVALGRTAMQQSDPATARAAYGQAIAHVQGRQRTLGGGWLVVQAQAGLARAGDGHALYVEASRLLQARDKFDFSWFWLCTEENTLLDLSRAAHALGLSDDARTLRQQAAERGSIEAARGLP
jgi:hypothetical protein